MKKYRLLFLLVGAVFVISACGPKIITKKEAFPGMYARKINSILVVPPINVTTAADASEYYSATIAEPASFTGYYIYPIEVVNAVFKKEGMADSALLLKAPPKKFREHFGADAVLFITITKWNTAYFVIGGNVQVGMEYRLVSTETGEVLWKYNENLVVDTSGGRGGGIAGLVLKIVETAIKTATTDYVPIAHRVNVMALSTMPYGQYNEAYMKDQDAKVVNEDKIKDQPPKQE